MLAAHIISIRNCVASEELELWTLVIAELTKTDNIHIYIYMGAH